MQITRQADYAVRAVLYLARLGNSERAATSTVAEEQRIPPSFLAKIISQLSIAGLLHTSGGARVGVTLARVVGWCAWLFVSDSFFWLVRLFSCLFVDCMCSLEFSFPFLPVWCEAQEELVKRLKGTTFAQLMEGSRATV